MTLISLIVLIAVIGMCVWAVTNLLPMPEPFKKAIYVLSVVALALYVLSALGLMSGLPVIRLK